MPAVKMTGKQLLDLDINKLFEEHTVKDIEQIQKKIQYESDRKKIELRTLVGLVFNYNFAMYCFCLQKFRFRHVL